ncbi:uncharacterized protein Triagg1_6215 [Trichoderma aggressivum f. europaeum]|uniref:F-box domain-containing protein n=1 Tax=Trichoderma aggressivum f. europaeum TaxID=173218 RepID=A0AAE1LXS6_9HYPO|nr:hypothetical protein Triagg1_6215 [Trichoderma aggressivum f. europaeum]
MDDLRKGHLVDASLAYLQKLEDEMRGLNGTQLVSSDSSTLGSPRKRRRLESYGDGYSEALKKIRITSAGQDGSRQLPAELWHHIFSFLPPAALGRCLRVNRLFHKYLDPVSPFIISAIHVPTTRMLPTLAPDAIWRASRRLHWPAMPTPLKGRFELDMWRFACTRSCQFCGQLDKAYNTAEDSSQRRRPGNTTVSPIFPFFINSCGNCLFRKSIKEFDFHLSSRSSFISPGLPMVFLTADMNVISPQEMQSIPVTITPIQVTKVYWPAQVEKLQEEYEEVKRFGDAAVEEWKKGLEVRHIEILRDASRWDRWLLSGGVRQMRRHSTQPTSTVDKPEWIGRKGSEIAKTLQKQRQDVETTVRIHISNLADEVIRDRWVKGRSVKKGNCADFAADVLAYVRKQFYKDGARAVSLTRGLTLDDMKWVFEHKIGPHTNNHQKDCFRCKECPGSKRYGFLAIIQHYAMKHGPKKSNSMTILWRTEWPKEPPFRCSVEQEASISSTPPMHQYSGEGLVASMHGVPDTYYVRERREHAPYATEAPSSDMALQREQSLDYRQPISSTTLHQSYGIVDVRNLPYGYYIQHPAILRNYSIPSNAVYYNYTLGGSYSNTGALSRVYNVYESRDPLANRRSGGWE